MPVNSTVRVPSLRRRKRLMTAIVIGLGAFPVGSAFAGPCASAYNASTQQAIPNCEDQVQPAVGYSGWDTKGWAYSCSGDHPYYWGLAAGWLNSFSANNNCFSIAENTVAEGSDSSKFDATITNWCLKKETLVVTLACSSTPTP